MRDLPDPLPRWRRSYDGEVDLSAYPEAFIGDLRGEKREPRIVVLGLNPGIAYPELQGFEGVWTCAARKDTYSRSSKHRVPFENGDWRKLHNGKDSRYFVNLVRFAKSWLRDEKAVVADILNMEMLPFHSKKKTRDIRPPHDILENYVWAPLREMETEVIFAFGSTGCLYVPPFSAHLLLRMGRTRGSKHFEILPRATGK